MKNLLEDRFIVTRKKGVWTIKYLDKCFITTNITDLSALIEEALDE